MDPCVSGQGEVYNKQIRVQKVFFGAERGGGSHRFQIVRDAGMEGMGPGPLVRAILFAPFNFTIHPE